MGMKVMYQLYDQNGDRIDSVTCEVYDPMMVSDWFKRRFENQKPHLSKKLADEYMDDCSMFWVGGEKALDASKVMHSFMGSLAGAISRTGIDSDAWEAIRSGYNRFASIEQHRAAKGFQGQLFVYFMAE